ncbi:MAG: hypothetical protein ACH350_05160 [Parachlamydiaceae bacterium]
MAIWNIERLRLNSKKRVQFRQDEFDVCQIIEELKHKQQELEKLLLKNKLSKETKESFESDLNAIQKQIAILKRKTLEPLE